VDRIITVILSEVTDDNGRFMGYEFEIDGETYFYSGNQWPGLRAGKFPCNADGRPFNRAMLHNVTRSPALAVSNDHAEMYQLA